jgi:hypothetical protein
MCNHVRQLLQQLFFLLADAATGTLDECSDEDADLGPGHLEEDLLLIHLFHSSVPLLHFKTVPHVSP